LPCKGASITPRQLPRQTQRQRPGHLGLEVGIQQQCGSHPHLGHALHNAGGTQGEAGVHVAIEAQQTDGPAVPVPERFLRRFRALDRRLPRCADQGHLPGVTEKAVQRDEGFGQGAFDVVHGMDLLCDLQSIATPNCLHAMLTPPALVW